MRSELIVLFLKLKIHLCIFYLENPSKENNFVNNEIVKRKITSISQ